MACLSQYPPPKTAPAATRIRRKKRTPRTRRTGCLRSSSMATFRPRDIPKTLSHRRLSGCSDAADQVLLLVVAFRADGEGVEDSVVQRVADGFVLTRAHCALAEDLHSHDALALRAHVADDRDDGVGMVVHVRADRIQPDQVDFDPGRCRRG